MLKAVAFDWGHTIMDERHDVEIPLNKRPIHLMPGVREVLPRLPLPLALWANTHEAREAEVRVWLGRAGIEQYFKWVITSVDAGARKPAPEFFEYALAQTGFAKGEVLFVGNQRNTDVRGGIGFGVSTVWISSTEYRSEDDREADNTVPTHTISTLDDLPALIACMVR
jgi:HAD superfamily hydrolase (TIGR01509 family)